MLAGYNTDMGLMPSGGGARSAARAGLSAALGLSLLGPAAPARGQTDQDGFYVGLEVGRANASTLTSVVTGVNHPTRCDRLLYPASTSPPASARAVRLAYPRQARNGTPYSCASGPTTEATAAFSAHTSTRVSPFAHQLRRY